LMHGNTDLAATDPNLTGVSFGINRAAQRCHGASTRGNQTRRHSLGL